MQYLVCHTSNESKFYDTYQSIIYNYYNQFDPICKADFSCTGVLYAQYLAAIDSEFKHVIQFLCKLSGLERQTRSGASETGGIVGIIENIKQDLEEEISKAKEEEVRALCCSCVGLKCEFPRDEKSQTLSGGSE